MARNSRPRGRKDSVGLGQILYWGAFILLVVAGIRAPGWFRYVGWALAAFFVGRSILGGRR